MNHFFYDLGKVGTHGKSKGDDTREDVRTSTSSLPTDRTTPIVSRMALCISIQIGVNSRDKINGPNTNGFAGYIGMFEDTRQVVNKIAHRGRTLDITRVARCTHSADIDGNDPIVVLPWVKKMRSVST